MEPHLIPQPQALQILQNLTPAHAAERSHIEGRVHQFALEKLQTQDILNASFTLIDMIKSARSIEPFEGVIDSALEALGLLAGQDVPEAIAILTQLSAHITANDTITPLLTHIRALAGLATPSWPEIQFFKNVQKLYGRRKLSDDEILKFHELWQKHPQKGSEFLQWTTQLNEARQKTIQMIMENGKRFPFTNLAWNEQVSNIWLELNAWAGFAIPKETRLYLQALLDQALLDNIQIHTDSIRLCTYEGGGETLLSTLEKGERGLKKRGLREGEMADSPDIRLLESENILLRERVEGSPVFQGEDWRYVTYSEQLAFISGTRFIYFAHKEGEPRRAFATLDIAQARLKDNKELDRYLNFLTEMSSQGLIENNGPFFDLWLSQEGERAKMDLVSQPIKELLDKHLSTFTPEQQRLLLDKTIQFNYELYTQMTIQKLMLGH